MTRSELNCLLPLIDMKKSREKFSEIYDKHIEKIYRFIYLKIGSRDQAEDLTSQTFVRGWEAFKKRENDNENEIKNMQAFLYQIARNLIADFYRKEERRTRLVSMENSNIEVEDPKPNPGEKSVFNSDLKRVQTALANLKEEYQNIIILRHVEDRSTQEVAEVMGKSEGAVRVQLHRALEALKEELSERE